MRFKTSTFDIEVKYKACGNEILLEEPVERLRTPDGKVVSKVRVVAKKRFMWNGKELAADIRLTDPETKKEVPISEAMEVLDNFNNKFLAEDGKLWEEDDLLHFAVKPDGSEGEFTPYPDMRKGVIDASNEENWVSSVYVDAFIVHQIYEVYTEDKKDAVLLFEEAEKRSKEDKVYLTVFSFGGTKAYYIFVCPFFKDGKYVWLLKFTEKKPVYNHLQDPPVVPKRPLREAPTLQTLPPVQILIAMAKKESK
jgi:hypothetical protein